MNEADAIRDLVIANRILSNENVVDAYGHISVRHPRDPSRFFLARSLAPDFVQKRDIMEFDLEGNIIGKDTRQPYLERFIHGAIYEARPEINSVVHAHAEDVLPFGITTAKMRPVIHSGAFIGHDVPVWDIADKFGDRTNLLVTNTAQGRDLARTLGANSVALMRGHGFAAAGRSIIEVVRISVYLPRNARAQIAAATLGGEVKPLSAGEIDNRITGYKPYAPETWRAWEYWSTRAGCGKMIGKPPTEKKSKGK
jgi:ribulose-5-phosphate 4-epimerase/fuculose-1-phosphate aldolase